MIIKIRKGAPHQGFSWEFRRYFSGQPGCSDTACKSNFSSLSTNIEDKIAVHVYIPWLSMPWGQPWATCWYLPGENLGCTEHFLGTHVSVWQISPLSCNGLLTITLLLEPLVSHSLRHTNPCRVLTLILHRIGNRKDKNDWKYRKNVYFPWLFS